MKYSTVSHNQSLSSMKGSKKEGADLGPQGSYWHLGFTKDTAVLEFRLSEALRKKQTKTVK